MFILQSKLAIYCLTNVSDDAQLAAIEWYNGFHGYVEPNCPCLAVCFDNGRCQLSRNEADESESVGHPSSCLSELHSNLLMFFPLDPILLDTGMTIMCAQWDHVGSVLAIAGSQRLGPGDKEINVVQFYNPFGEVG